MLFGRQFIETRCCWARYSYSWMIFNRRVFDVEVLHRYCIMGLWNVCWCANCVNSIYFRIYHFNNDLFWKILIESFEYICLPNFDRKYSQLLSENHILNGCNRWQKIRKEGIDKEIRLVTDLFGIYINDIQQVHLPRTMFFIHACTICIPTMYQYLGNKALTHTFSIHFHT